MREPIISFKSDYQFISTCKWWQHRLNLDDWFIKFNLQRESNDEYLGLTTYNFVNKSATIEINNVDECAELNLVHELLHLLVPFMDENSMDIDASDEICNSKDKFRYSIIHQSLEELAKGLLMVKYNSIDRKFFSKIID